jgi:hypothetical protein
MERCVESPALEPPSETREAPETAAAPRQGLEGVMNFSP